MRNHPVTRAALAAALLLSAACGSDPSGPETPNIAGTWRLSWTNMLATSGSDAISCNATLDFVLTQSGTTFSGVQTGSGVFSCFLNGQFLGSETVTGETLTNGQLNGSSITFRLGSIEGPHSGTVAGTSMSGSATWSIDPGTGTRVNLTGQWTGARL